MGASDRASSSGETEGHVWGPRGRDSETDYIRRLPFAALAQVFEVPDCQSSETGLKDAWRRPELHEGRGRKGRRTHDSRVGR